MARRNDNGVFSTDQIPYSSGVHIKLPNGEKTINGELTVSDLLAIASDAGIRDFNVFDSNNKQLKAADFPIRSGDIKIVPVNKAGQF